MEFKSLVSIVTALTLVSTPLKAEELDLKLNINLPKLTTEEKKEYPYLPKPFTNARKSTGSSSNAKIELPGNFDYNFLNNTLTSGNEEITYKPGKDFFSHNETELSLTGGLENFSFGGITDFFNIVSEIKNNVDELRNDFNQLNKDISNIVGPDNINIFNETKKFTENLFNKYARDGIITPEEQEAIKEKSVIWIVENENNTTIPNNEQISDIQDKLNTFSEKYKHFQEKFKVSEILGAINTKNSFCEIGFNEKSLCDYYNAIKSLDPELLTVKEGENELTITTKEINASINFNSSNSHTFKDNLGRSITASKESSLFAQIKGSAFFHGKIKPGVELRELIPSEYRQYTDSIIGNERLSDLETELRADYNLYLISKKYHGFMSSFLINNQEVGMSISFGSDYSLISSGKANLTAKADSKNNFASLNLDTETFNEESFVKKQIISLFTSSINKDSWYSVDLSLENFKGKKKNTKRNSSLHIEGNYLGEISKEEQKTKRSKEIDTYTNLEFNGAIQGGLNLNSLGIHGSLSINDVRFGTYLNSEYSFLSGIISKEKLKATVQIPLYGKLNKNSSKKNFIEKQKLDNRKVAGIEAIKNEEDMRYNRSLSGIFFKGETQYNLNKKGNPNHEISFIIAKNNDFTEIKYFGNFSKNNGSEISIGLEHFTSTFGISKEKNKILETNSTTFRFNNVLHIGELDLAQSLELFTAGHDLDPRNEKTETGYKQVKENEFKALFEIVGKQDTLDYLITELSKFELEQFAVNTVGITGQNTKLRSEIITDYRRGNLSLHNEIFATTNTKNEVSLELNNETLYQIDHGLGLAIIYKNIYGENNENSRFLPGIGFEKQLDDHYIKGIVGISYQDDKVLTDIKARYLFDELSKKTSPCTKIEVSYFLRNLETADGYLRIYSGWRDGSLILSGYAEAGSDNNLGLGVSIGIKLD